MNAPLVTVIMPVRNTAAYVAEAAHSVLRQTLRDLALLVVDDASTDGSGDLVRALGDPRVRVIRSDTPLNAAGARNLALAEAKSEFVAFLDADDVALPSRLATQIDLLRKSPRAVVSASPVTLINEAGAARGRNFAARPSAEIAVTLLFENCLALSSVTARRAALQAFRPESAPAEDYDLWTRLSPVAEFAMTTRPLTRYRINTSGVSAREPARMRQAVAAIHAAQLDRLGFRETPAIHELLAAWPLDATASHLAEAEAWLLALAVANERRKIYPPDTFRKVLAARWFTLCMDSWLLGWPVWGVYHHSLLAAPSLTHKMRLLRRLLPQRFRRR